MMAIPLMFPVRLDMINRRKAEMSFSREHTDLTRRGFFKTALCVSAVFFFPNIVLGRPAPPERERSLSFLNLHTGEHINTAYWADGDYLPEGLLAINHLMRDFRTGDQKKIDHRLLELLYQTRMHLETEDHIHLISGYRSPKTNAMLRKHSKGVALHSLHMDGKAADIRIPGRTLEHLHQVALSMRGGGVGYYPHSGFVHIDCGRVRSWHGK